MLTEPDLKPPPDPAEKERKSMLFLRRLVCDDVLVPTELHGEIPVGNVPVRVEVTPYYDDAGAVRGYTLTLIAIAPAMVEDVLRLLRQTRTASVESILSSIDSDGDTKGALATSPCFDIRQEFAEGFDPDRIVEKVTADSEKAKPVALRTQDPVRSVIPEVVPPIPPPPPPEPRTVDVRATPAPVKALAPVPPKVEQSNPARSPAGDVRQEFDLEKLRACKTLKAIVELLKEWGWTTQEAMLAKCEELKASGTVPYLNRVADVPGRVKLLFA